MREAEYYEKIGYEDHGYVSPELSSSDTYPDYIRREVLKKAAEIQALQNHHTITFAFMTDLHYALSYNHEIRMKRTINAYRELAKRVHIDKLILGGDYTNEGCKEYKGACFRELRALFDGIDYFPVHGNHDDGTIWDESYLRAQRSVNHLSHEELYSLFYNHLPSKGARFDPDHPSLYYYMDDDYSKTRYVCLDSGDIPYHYDETGKLLFGGQHLFAMSQNQLDWLARKALHFEEEGWSVCFFIHSLARPSKHREELGNIRKRMPVLTDLVDAFQRGGRCRFDSEEPYFETHLDVDFSSCQRADVIGFFVGDFHIDEIEIDPCGIPYVLTGNAVMYQSAGGVPRYDGDQSEILFDVITVNKAEKRIDVTRIGAGESRSVNYER